MKYILPLLLALVLGNACNQPAKKEVQIEKNYEAVKESLEDTEKKYPKKFILVEGDKKKNLLGQTVVRGVIINIAKVITYKDVVIKIQFYSKTAALLEEDIETIYENIAPGKEVNFKSKFYTPKGTDSVKFSVEDAKY